MSFYHTKYLVLTRGEQKNWTTEKTEKKTNKKKTNREKKPIRIF
jgi:hypothetical protein